MSQQASDLPRSVRIIGQYKILIGLVAVLGVIFGVAVGALYAPTVTSNRALVEFTAPSCPQGAICGGPMFSPQYVAGEIAAVLPANVQINLINGNVVDITATGGNSAQAEAAANAAAQSYLSYDASLTYLGEHPSATIIQPAGAASAVTSPKRLFDAGLLGAVFGLLVGVIAALAAGQSIIDPVRLPRGASLGGDFSRTGPARGYGFTTGLSLEQMAKEYVSRGPDPDRPEAGNP
jgi:hypothetical protein